MKRIVHQPKRPACLVCHRKGQVRTEHDPYSGELIWFCGWCKASWNLAAALRAVPA